MNKKLWFIPVVVICLVIIFYPKNKKPDTDINIKNKKTLDSDIKVFNKILSHDTAILNGYTVKHGDTMYEVDP